MTTFTIDTDNNITAHDATPAAQDNVAAFATEKELTKLSADWPITRFVEVWNAFAARRPSATSSRSRSSPTARRRSPGSGRPSKRSERNCCAPAPATRKPS